LKLTDNDAWNAYLVAGEAGTPKPEADTFIVLPVLDQPGDHYVVFGDGSYVKDWMPSTGY
jgi:hypothetical protein